MIEVFRQQISNEDIKAKAQALGMDLVGIADGKVMDAYPPDPRDPRRPSDITALDADRVVVLGKHYTAGTTRLTRWDERHKYYNDELTLTVLEEASLELVYWLEDNGYPAIVIPPTHVDPWRYEGDPDAHMGTILSLTHAAVEAGLGTLGLNLQLLTPQLPKSRAEITAVQQDRKVAAVRNALRAPFHKQRLKGVDPEQMTDPAKWREIPLLTKEDLRQLSPQQYFSDFCLAKPHEVAEYWRSGGVTGEPFFYPRTYTDLPYCMLGFDRTFLCVGFEKGDTCHMSLPLGIHPAGQMWARSGQKLGIGMIWAG